MSERERKTVYAYVRTLCVRERERERFHGILGETYNKEGIDNDEHKLRRFQFLSSQEKWEEMCAI